MLYSVWNQSAKLYDYYEAPGSLKTAHVASPKHLPKRQLGSTPSQAAYPLPASARPVGSGERAKGHIAARKSGLSGLDGFLGLDSTMLTYAALALGGYLLWKKTK